MQFFIFCAVVILLAPIVAVILQFSVLSRQKKLTEKLEALAARDAAAASGKPAADQRAGPSGPDHRRLHLRQSKSLTPNVTMAWCLQRPSRAGPWRRAHLHHQSPCGNRSRPGFPSPPRKARA